VPKCCPEQILALPTQVDDPGPGPHGFSSDDLRAIFAEGWHVNYIGATQFAINEMPVHKTSTWLASLTRD